MKKPIVLLAGQVALIAASLCLSQIVSVLMKWFEWNSIRAGAHWCGMVAIGLAIGLIFHAKKTPAWRGRLSLLLGAIGLGTALGFFRVPVAGVLDGSIARIQRIEGADEDTLRGYTHLADSVDLDGYVSKVVAKEELPEEIRRVFGRMGMGEYSVRAIDAGGGRLYLRVGYPLYGEVSVMYYLGSPDSLDQVVKQNASLKMIFKHLYVQSAAAM